MSNECRLFWDRYEEGTLKRVIAPAAIFWEYWPSHPKPLCPQFSLFLIQILLPYKFRPHNSTPQNKSEYLLPTKIIQIYWSHRRAHFFALLIGAFNQNTTNCKLSCCFSQHSGNGYDLLVASSVAIHLVDLVDGDNRLTRSLRTLAQPTTSILHPNRKKRQCMFNHSNCILEVFKIAIATKLSTLRPHLPHSFTSNIKTRDNTASYH